MFGFLSKVIKPVANIGRKVASKISNSGLGSKVSSLSSQAVGAIKSLVSNAKSMMGFNNPAGVVKETIIQKGGKIIKPVINKTAGLFPPMPTPM